MVRLQEDIFAEVGANGSDSWGDGAVGTAGEATAAPFDASAAATSLVALAEQLSQALASRLREHAKLHSHLWARLPSRWDHLARLAAGVLAASLMLVLVCAVWSLRTAQASEVPEDAPAYKDAKAPPHCDEEPEHISEEEYVYGDFAGSDTIAYTFSPMPSFFTPGGTLPRSTIGSVVGTPPRSTLGSLTDPVSSLVTSGGHMREANELVQGAGHELRQHMLKRHGAPSQKLQEPTVKKNVFGDGEQAESSESDVSSGEDEAQASTQTAAFGAGSLPAAAAPAPGIAPASRRPPRPEPGAAKTSASRPPLPRPPRRAA